MMTVVETVRFSEQSAWIWILDYTKQSFSWRLTERLKRSHPESFMLHWSSRGLLSCGSTEWACWRATTTSSSPSSLPRRSSTRIWRLLPIHCCPLMNGFSTQKLILCRYWSPSTNLALLKYRLSPKIRTNYN